MNKCNNYIDKQYDHIHPHRLISLYVCVAVSVDDGHFKRCQGDRVCCVSAFAQRMRTEESPV